MGFFKELRAQAIDVIEYNQTDSNILVYKYPITTKEQIENGAQLIVKPSQVAVFVYEGEITDIYESGKHTLKTDTMPITTALKNWKYGFNSPFKTDIYFISIAVHLNQTWGTTSPLLLRDIDFGNVQLRAHGKFSFKVSDPKKLLAVNLNCTDSVTVDLLIPQIKSTIVSVMKDFLATSKIPVLDIATQFIEFGEEMTKVLEPEFQEMAIDLVKFIVEDVSLPATVQDAIDKQATIRATGNLDNLMKYETANSIDDMARNEGGLAGMGASVAMGANMGQMMGGLFNSSNQNQSIQQDQYTNQNQEKNNAAIENNKNNKFCIHCGAKLDKNAKFCSDCGEKQNIKKTCPKCNIEVSNEQKFCINCGEGLL